MIVESVRHFVADHYADSAVVHRVVGCRVEERRLEDCCREANFIGGRVVIGIDRLGSHEPLLGIYRLADFGELIAGRPLAGTLDILPVGEGRVDFERGVVLPFIGVADLHVESGEFLAGTHLGRVAHPVELIDVLAEGRAEVLHQGHHAGLVFGGEELLDVHFAYGLAQGAVGNGHGTLPAGAGLLFA